MTCLNKHVIDAQPRQVNKVVKISPQQVISAVEELLGIGTCNDSDTVQALTQYALSLVEQLNAAASQIDDLTSSNQDLSYSIDHSKCIQC